MPVVVVANPKGGVGKSTLSTNVAGYFAAQGHAVMLGDADRQQSSRLWLGLRPPAARPIATWDVNGEQIAKPPKGTTHVVLDTPAGLHGWRFNDVIKLADKVIVPLQPSIFDIFATRTFLDQLDQLFWLWFKADMHIASAIHQIKLRYRSLAPLMDERMRRQWAATEAQTYGWGGLSAVSDATGMSRNTIRRGVAELEVRKKKPKTVVEARLRGPGGGRKRLTESGPGLLEALEVLVEPMSRGDPQSVLRWTCKSTARLAEELTRPAGDLGGHKEERTRRPVQERGARVAA